MRKSSQRKSISKKIRFEVFKRDSFTCQYCGGKSPDIVLQVDHIEPISKGGDNDIFNLISSCQACNAGKSDRKLSDNTTIEKQRQQLEELQQRKEQIEMLMEWRKGLAEIDQHIEQELADLWTSQVEGYSLNESGLKSLRRHIKRFGFDEVSEAIHIAVDRYLKYEQDIPTKESVELAWDKVGGICSIRKREKENPDQKELKYIAGILRNRLNYMYDGQAFRLLEQASTLGATIDSLKKHAMVANYWTEWRDEIQDFIYSEIQSAKITK